MKLFPMILVMCISLMMVLLSSTNADAGCRFGDRGGRGKAAVSRVKEALGVVSNRLDGLTGRLGGRLGQLGLGDRQPVRNLLSRRGCRS